MVLRRAASWGSFLGLVAASSARRKVDTSAILSVLAILGSRRFYPSARYVSARCKADSVAKTPCGADYSSGRVGVLRLRRSFASRMARCDQDDKFWEERAQKPAATSSRRGATRSGLSLPAR